MAQRKKSNLLEDAASVLQASISASRPKADTFGLGKTLHTGPFTVPQKDLGPANVTSDDVFPNYHAGVPTAVPPGATPPVGQEPMHHLEKDRGNQPQLHQGHGNNTDPTKPPYPDYNSFSKRISNVTPHIHPGQGNVNMPWAHEDVKVDDLVTKLSEMHGSFHFSGKKHKDHDDKVKEVSAKMKKEGIDISEDAVYEMLSELFAEPVDTKTALENIVNDILNGVKEDFSTDINAIFEGQTVSDEFKTQATTIFEAAVYSQVKTITTALAEFTEKNINEAVEQVKESLTDKVDEYLNYMVSEWINENEIAVESGLKNEIIEGFIVGLKNLFQENYIEIPDDKVDMVEALSSKVSKLEDQLNAEIQMNMHLKEQLTSIQKSEIVDEICEGLTTTEKDKISTLAEGVVFSTEKEFKLKVSTLKENYFPKTKLVKPDMDSLNADSLILESDKPDVPGKNITDPDIKYIYDNISRISKR